MLAARRMMGHPGYFDLVMSQQPVFYYRMGDAAASNMEESVEAYDGVYNSTGYSFEQGSLLSSGRGKSVQFNSASTCAGVIAYKAAMADTSLFSISMIVLPSETTPSAAKVFFHTGDAAVGGQAGFFWAINTSGYAYFQFKDTGGTWRTQTGSSVLFASAAITHLAFVCSASGKYAYVYRNGILHNSLSWATASWPNPSQDWKIGSLETGTTYGNSFVWYRVQEVAMWQSILSAQEIAAQANAA